jgi:hypothetical protein
MPSRQLKNQARNSWRLCFRKQCPDLKTHKKKIERKCETLQQGSEAEAAQAAVPGGPAMVKLAGSGAGWMDLVWEKAVKYDAAVKWISRQVDADKSQWTVI